MAATCIVIPVPETGHAVDLLRRRHTRDGAEGMPAHITLIYPFTDDAHLTAGRMRDVRAVLGRFAVFEFQLSVVHRFDNLPYESYATVLPSRIEPFVEMIEALAAEFPEHPPFGGAFRNIVPHLTVAASSDEDVLRSVEA